MTRTRLTGIIGLLLFLSTLLCFLATLTQVHTYDALSYVMDVDRKPWHEVFHPHHLAYGPMGVLVRSLLQAVGWQGSVLLPLQGVNALSGALGVVLFFALVQSHTRRLDVALAVALLLGTSYAWWYYAIEVEVYTIAALFLIICLWLLTRVLQNPTPGQCAALGLSQSVAILFHQTNLLLCVPVGVAFLLHLQGPGPPPTTMRGSRKTRRLLLACLLAYALPLALVAGGSYLLVGFAIVGAESWGDFLAWATAYARTGWWGGPITTRTWEHLAAGLSHTLAQPGGALLGLLLLGLLVFFLRRVLLVRWQLVLCLGTWLLSYGAFFTWWEPQNIEFWIACIPPALLLLALALHAGGGHWHAGVWVALAVGATMWSVNHEAITWRGNAANDVHRRLAHALARRSDPHDLLLVADELQELLLPYYENRVHTWSLNKAINEAEGDWSVACTLVQQRIEAALARGAAVLISHEVRYPPTHRTPFSDPILERAGLTQQEITHCFAPYQSALHPVDLGDGLPGYYRIPTAQEMLEQGGWDFSHARWGWQARNVSNERLDEQLEKGWSFVPGVDPQLISPPFHADFSHYQAIEVRIATAPTTKTEKFELFFFDEHGIIDTAHAVQRTLQRDGDAKTHRINLVGREGWSGPFTRLRLDPIGEGDGGRVRVEWVRIRK
jgi:hypothetical protein